MGGGSIAPDEVVPSVLFYPIAAFLIVSPVFFLRRAIKNSFYHMTSPDQLSDLKSAPVKILLYKPCRQTKFGFKMCFSRLN
jgi:hypothetical protein